MDEAIREFERYVKRRYPGRSTAKHYSSDLQIFHRFVDKPAREVTRWDVDRFVEDQLAQGHSATTVNRRLACLRHFFEFLADEADDVSSQYFGVTAFWVCEQPARCGRKARICHDKVRYGGTQFPVPPAY